MNIISIIVKEVKHNLRDKKSMSMMILFPIVLIVVLGAAFKNNFNGNSIDIGTPKVFYSIQAKGMAADMFETNFIDRGKEHNIKFVKTDDVEKAKKELTSSDDYSGVIVMKDDSNIELYKNDSGSMNFKGGIVESFVSVYVEKYNMIATVQQTKPMAIKDIVNDTNPNYTKISSISKTKEPSSLDYYAVAEIALIIMYAACIGLYGMANEKNLKTGNRILSSPVGKYEFLFGKTIGGVVVAMIQILVVVLFSKYVLKANLGSDIFTVMLIFLSQIIMAISLGVGLGFIFKKENIANGVLNFIIPVLVFLGGSYAKIDGGSKTFDMVTYLSPVRWVNKSIFQVIYSNDYSKVLPAIVINITIAFIFLAIATISFRKESI